jgi:hypothetical protein
LVEVELLRRLLRYQPMVVIQYSALLLLLVVALVQIVHRMEMLGDLAVVAVEAQTQEAQATHQTSAHLKVIMVEMPLLRLVVGVVAHLLLVVIVLVTQAATAVRVLPLLFQGLL